MDLKKKTISSENNGETERLWNILFSNIKYIPIVLR